MPVALAVNPFENILKGGRSFLQFTQQYADSTIFFIVFTLILAVFWIGISIVSKKEDWNKNSMLAIAIVVALGTSIPITLWLTRLGVSLVDLIAKPFVIAIIVAVIGILGSIFYNANDKKSTAVPYILAISIILLDNVLSRDLFYGPEWTSNLGSVGVILDAIIFFAWLFFIIAMIRYLFKVFSTIKLELKKIAGDGTETKRKQRNVERDAKREKTKILNEFIEEKKELELVEKAIEENNSLWVALENLFNLKIPPITPKIKEIKDLFTDLNKTVTELDREFSRLNRATYKQERAGGKLIKDLEDSEVNKTVLEQAKVYEKEILKFHDLAIKSLNRVKTMLGQLKTVAFDLSPSKWLKTLGTDNFGSPHFYSELKAIYSDLEEIKKAEEQVITQTEELISYFQKYWKQ